MKAQLLSALLLSPSAASTVHSLVFIHCSSVQIQARKVLWGRITSSSFKTRNRNTLCTIHFLFISVLKDKGMQKKKKKENEEEDFVFS